jgi:ElaB/YqjD/DUF883 family membrane-anchored ribosome-binding protein
MSPEEKTGKGKAANAGTEPTPAEIRAEIEETREELGDTVEALAEKTDVKAQAKAKVEDVKEKVNENPKPVAIAGALVVLFILWRLLRS